VELRDPSLSVEEHLGHVNKRAEKLKKAHPSALSSSVRIIPRDAFYVIGYPLATTTERSRSEIPVFWDRFFEFGGPDKLGKIAEQERGWGDLWRLHRLQLYSRVNSPMLSVSM